ncbi:MAG: GNAT family N-acetyltransferase [Candidatus Babeliales bacterium]
MNITFKPITEFDFPQLFRWVHTPHVKKWWHLDALPWEQFQEKYTKNLHNSNVHGYIFSVDEEPLGFIQYYDAHKIPDAFGNKDPEGTYGMDLYIANPEYLGKGYGTKTLQAFLTLIKQRHTVKKFIIDPHPDNIAAIKAYEKVGFNKIHEEDQPNYGKVVIMELNL